MGRLDATGINELHARLPGLADLKRLLIIDELRDGQRSVGDLAGALGYHSHVSRHLGAARPRLRHQQSASTAASITH